MITINGHLPDLTQPQSGAFTTDFATSGAGPSRGTFGRVPTPSLTLPSANESRGRMLVNVQKRKVDQPWKTKQIQPICKRCTKASKTGL